MIIINENELATLNIGVRKLWGMEYWLVNNEKYCSKLLKLNPGMRCSIHAHRKKDETFFVLSGEVQLNFHNSEGELVSSSMLGGGRQFRIRKDQFHSFQSNKQSWILEVSTHHDDADVIRLQESTAL